MKKETKKKKINIGGENVEVDVYSETVTEEITHTKEYTKEELLKEKEQLTARITAIDKIIADIDALA